jgi:ribosome-associated protein
MADYIELNSFLKAKQVAATGGTAKLLIRGGVVKVNGEVETRNKRKLHSGDKVECQGKHFVVDSSVL